jgi:hypothetical protein
VTDQSTEHMMIADQDDTWGLMTFGVGTAETVMRDGGAGPTHLIITIEAARLVNNVVLDSATQQEFVFLFPPWVNSAERLTTLIAELQGYLEENFDG